MFASSMGWSQQEDMDPPPFRPACVQGSASGSPEKHCTKSGVQGGRRRLRRVRSPPAASAYSPLAFRYKNQTQRCYPRVAQGVHQVGAYS